MTAWMQSFAFGQPELCSAPTLIAGRLFPATEIIFIGSTYSSIQQLLHNLVFSRPLEWWIVLGVFSIVLSISILMLIQRRITLYRLECKLNEDRRHVERAINEHLVARLQNEVLKEEIQERKKVEERVRHLTSHDELTGLGNRACLLDELQKAINWAHNKAGASKFLVCIDLDNFKSVNELLGPRDGDLLLQAIGRRLEKCTRDDDILVRVSADEFCILLGKIHEIGHIGHVAGRILSSIEEPMPLDEICFPITASIGICEVNERYTDSDDVLRDAETAVSRAKRNGGNQYAFYDCRMHDEAVFAIQTTLQLRSAIQQNEFELYYQPILDMRDMSIAGVESLIRWNHPRRGVLAPGAFIQLAEETGYIVPIGAWSLRQSALDIQAMRHALNRDLLLSLNVSSRQLDDPSFLSRVASFIESCDTDPHLLQLEITESVFLKDPDRTGDLFREIRAMGLKVAFDDFGTGYSSLSYLQKYPVDTLKIDRSFVSDMKRGSVNYSIVRLLIDLAQSTGMTVVAEGIESTEQAERLLSLGCNYAQGYLFSKPVSMDALLQLMKWGVKSPQIKVT